MTNAPDDLSLGEVWRLLVDLRDEVKAIPALLAKELDERARKDDLVALKTELDLKIKKNEDDVSFLKKVLWSVVGFVFLAVGSAVISLVLHSASV